MRLHDETIQQVRERAQILDLFGSGDLKRVGAEFVTRCPWHDDKRPSLTVSPKTNRAYCFVCARGVDAIGWIQDREGLTFTDAVMRLAERVGVPVRAENPEDSAKLEAERAERLGLLRQREQLRQQFASQVWTSPAWPYLSLERGLTERTVREWELGWNGARVMIPLNDPQGRTVGFTGRALGDEKPKYKNTKNDLIYRKGDHVFGLDKARPEIVRCGTVVVVEGQLDVIRCWQEGLRNLVAVSGSSLTRDMIERLLRTTKARRIVLCFDGDKAGELAGRRALEELRDLVLRGELELRILSLPPGKDPADLAPQMARLLAGAPHWVEWWFDREVQRIDLSDPAQIQLAEAGVKRILQVLPTGGLREYVQRRSAELLKAVPVVPPARIQTQAVIDRCRWAERRALRLYLLEPGCRPALSGVTYRDPIHQRAWELVGLIETMTGGDPERVARVFAEAILAAPDDLQALMRPLVSPIPDVLRIIRQDPAAELQAALDVLLSADCQCSDSDDLGTL